MDFLVKLFRRDILRKIVALFFAILLYWTISERNGSEARFDNIKLNIEYPEGIVNADNDDIMVEVDCVGSKRVLQSFNLGDIRGEAKVSIENYVEDRPYTLKIDERNFNIPFGMRILRVNPNTIRLNLESIISKNVEVKPNYNINKLPADYQIKNIKLNPNTVEIEGPSSLINTIHEIETEEIPLDISVRESFDYPSKLSLPAGISSSINKVMSHIEVKKSFESREYLNIPINLQINSTAQKKFEYMITPQTVTIKLHGTLSELSQIHTNDIKVFLDLRNVVTNGVYNLEAKCFIDSPTKVEIISIMPKQIKVTVKH